MHSFIHESFARVRSRARVGRTRFGPAPLFTMVNAPRETREEEDVALVVIFVPTTAQVMVSPCIVGKSCVGVCGTAPSRGPGDARGHPRVVTRERERERERETHTVRPHTLSNRVSTLSRARARHAFPMHVESRPVKITRRSIHPSIHPIDPIDRSIDRVGTSTESVGRRVGDRGIEWAWAWEWMRMRECERERERERRGRRGVRSSRSR